MLTSNFININNPKCLYCNSTMIKNYSENTKQFLNCQDCKESCIIDLVDTEKFFTFSCKDIAVVVALDSEKLFLCHKYKINKESGTPYIDINYFYLDFRNKSKMYEKLKTYLTFY